jgi:hypothetical protein
MKSALTAGTLFTVLSLWVGTHWAGLTIPEVLLAVLVSNVVGCITLLGVLALERQREIQRRLLNGYFKIWGFMAFFYFGGQQLLLPQLRDFKTVAMMTPTLLMSVGLMLPIFGIFQDKLIARGQRKVRSQRTINSVVF